MKRFLVCLLVFSFLPIILSAQRIYLVSVGVADYPGVINDVPGPDMDARVMYTLYQGNRKASCYMLINEDATLKAVKEKMRNLFSRASKDDIVVFFFSGHGSPGVFHLYDGDFAYREVRKIFSECKAKNKMVFANACFSGAMRENKSSVSSAFQNNKSNVMLFLSSREDEYSYVNENDRNSFFTTCLVRSLKGGADYDRNRVITARELFLGVHRGVVEMSGDLQHPVMWGNFSNDMPVMVW